MSGIGAHLHYRGLREPHILCWIQNNGTTENEILDIKKLHMYIPNHSIKGLIRTKLAFKRTS